MGVNSTEDAAEFTWINHVPVIAVKIDAVERNILMISDLIKLLIEKVRAIRTQPAVINNPMGGVLRKSTWKMNSAIFIPSQPVSVPKKILRIVPDPWKRSIMSLVINIPNPKREPIISPCSREVVIRAISKKSGSRYVKYTCIPIPNVEPKNANI